MRMGQFDVGFSAGADVSIPPPPQPPSASVDVSWGIEAEAIALGADGPPPPPPPPPNPLLATGLQYGSVPTGAQRYAKYLAVAGGNKYASASFAGTPEDQAPTYGTAPARDRGVAYRASGGGEISTGAIVAGGAVVLGLGLLAAWRFGAFR